MIPHAQHMCVDRRIYIYIYVYMQRQERNENIVRYVTYIQAELHSSIEINFSGI